MITRNARPASVNLIFIVFLTLVLPLGNFNFSPPESNDPYLVLDINQRTGDGSPSSPVNFKGALYFLANTGHGESSLVKSDGAEGGTEIIKSYSSPLTVAWYMNGLRATNEKLFFLVDDSEATYNPLTGLWVSDGTEAGTSQISYAGYKSHIEMGVVVGDKLFLYGSNPVGDLTLSVIDGTPEGTQQLLTYDTYNPSRPGFPHSTTPWAPASMGGALYFWYNNYDWWNNISLEGYELWKSDGTPEGTVLVKDILPGSGSSFPGHLTAGDGILYFTAEDGFHGRELWRSDGTDAGTVMVADLNSGSGSTDFQSFTVANNTLFFTANAGDQAGLWRSDGSAASTVLLKPFADLTQVGNLTPAGPDLYFSAPAEGLGIELWKSDGTSEGTVLVKDIHPGSATSSPTNFAYVGQTLYFSADDGSHGSELWKSDGTPAGTVLVKDIYSGPGSSSPGQFGSLDGTVFFSATDEKHGIELWKSDGTEAGTVLVKDLFAQTAGSDLTHLTPVGNRLFFAADDGKHGRELWKSDGTWQGTVLVKDLTPGYQGSNFLGFAASGERLFFATGDIPSGQAVLWISNGSPEGTIPLKTLQIPGTCCPFWLTASDLSAYFLDGEDELSIELWTSDGTPEGTRMVRDFNLGEDNYFPILGHAFSKHQLYISLYYTNLWKSDGTEAGTVLAKDFDGPIDIPPQSSTAFDQSVYFFHYTGDGGSELWKSDGTETGTVKIKSFESLDVIVMGVLPPLVSLNDEIYFSADDGIHGTEVWKSDGTEIGTTLLKDILPGSGSSSPQNFALVNDHIFFSASSGGNMGLWKSDGTSQETVLVKTLAPSQLTEVNDILFFLSGGLWRSDGTEAGTTVLVDDLGVGDWWNRRIAGVRSTLFFPRAHPDTGLELWALRVPPHGLYLPLIHK